MALWTAIVLLLLFLIVPFGMGNVLIRSESFLLTVVGGLFASFCLFELLALVFHITAGSLRLLTAIWCTICGMVALFGWFSGSRGKRPTLTKGTPWTCTEKGLLLIAVALIALQTINTVFNTHYSNWDDTTYCGTAVTSWYTDTVDRYTPYSGVLEDAFYNARYNIASWPTYSSMLAVLTGVHPAIIFRTILPLVETPFAYFVAYLLIRFFFQGRRAKALLALIFFQLFTLLGAEHMPQTSGEWWMTVNCWTGKALAASIMAPLILWLLIQLEESQTHKEKTGPTWRVLWFVCGACCLISASLFFMVPIELLLWGGLYLFRTKRWEDIPKFILCGMPTALCVVAILVG